MDAKWPSRFSREVTAGPLSSAFLDSGGQILYCRAALLHLDVEEALWATRRDVLRSFS